VKHGSAETAKTPKHQVQKELQKDKWKIFNLSAVVGFGVSASWRLGVLAVPLTSDL
jgi:hypothetical protein